VTNRLENLEQSGNIRIVRENVFLHALSIVRDTN